MLVLLILLSVAVGLTGYFEWNTWGFGRPARCSFHERMDTGPAFQSMIITITLLIYGYLIRIAKMIRKSANGMRVITVFVIEGEMR